MTVTHLASHESQVQAGYLVAMIGIPAIGLVCLIVGLVERSRSRRRSGPYPPPHPMAPAYPIHTGYLYPYPGYPAAPYPGYPPGYPPRRRTSTSATTLITIGTVVLAFGILGNLAANAARLGEVHGAGGTSLRVGDCISESDYASNHFDAHPNGGCANPAATYELAFKGGASDSCPDGKREHSIYERATNHSTTLCFIINLLQGRCYQMISDGEAVSLRPGDCAKSGLVQVKVSQRIDGSADRTRCQPGEKGVGYPVPARVYCLVRAE